jgi:hypothetical protein
MAILMARFKFQTIAVACLSVRLASAGVYSYQLERESDRLDFYKKFEISGYGGNKWNCRALPQIDDFSWFLLSLPAGSDPLADLFFKPPRYLHLNDEARSAIFSSKAPTKDGLLSCTLDIESTEQADKFSDHFKERQWQKLEFPWYFGLLTDVLGKLGAGVDVGKTIFDRLWERSPQDRMAAAAMVPLIAIGGQFRQTIVASPSDLNKFQVVIEYTVQVGKNPEHRVKFVLYSASFRLSKF